jgi:hypothetical protein
LAGWSKKISVDHLPPRFRLDGQNRPRTNAKVFIEYLEQRAGGGA